MESAGPSLILVLKVLGIENCPKRGMIIGWEKYLEMHTFLTVFTMPTEQVTEVFFKIFDELQVGGEITKLHGRIAKHRFEEFFSRLA